MSSEHLNSTPLDEQMAARLRQAVRSEPVPPELAVKIRQRLDEERARGFGSFWRMYAWVPTAAALIVCVAAGIAYQQGHLRLTPGQRESFMESVLVNVSNPMRPGMDDHLHCSVYGRVPATIPPLAEAVKDLPPQFRELLTVVQEKVPPSFGVYSAHQCTRHGRKFVHIQLKSDSKLLSVIVTRRSVDESFVRDQIVPALTERGISLYEARSKRFAIAALETRDYLAYVVSDLGGEENRQLMLAMAPGMESVLRRLES
ncbi:hypothetical protein [uncultured Paludibaculum sp.]|uniref:hypothetical protein n=1 Tax=uncultured Paludibaculum sp. TaxID=1765020 RepID=UPI002AAB7CB8|nr:hypothetical protein [uncultured Paludibaculum sp.]